MAGIEAGFAALAEQDADFARVLGDYGPPPVRTRPEGFASLLKIIVEQQVSVASAAAIWARLADGLGDVVPSQVLAAGDERLRELGLSRPKARYALALARMVDDGSLALDRLAAADDDEVAAALTTVPGIGRWSAEIYLLSALQRPDVWPAADLALMVAAQHLKGLEGRPDVREMDALAEAWRPLRAYAARLLWHYYRHALGRAAPI